MGPTAVGSSEAVKMGTFDGTPRPKVGQVSSRDMKRPVVAHSFSRGTTTCELTDLNTLERLLIYYLSQPQ